MPNGHKQLNDTTYQYLLLNKNIYIDIPITE